MQAVLPLCLHDCGCLLFLACAEEILLRHIRSLALLHNPPLSLPLHLHLTSLSVLLLHPLSPCIGHVSLRFCLLSSVLDSHRVHDVPSLLLSQDVPWALISLCSQHLCPSSHHLCISLSSTLCLLVASYRHLVHHSFNFLEMPQHVCFGLMPSAAVWSDAKTSPQPCCHLPCHWNYSCSGLEHKMSSNARTSERQLLNR